VKEETFGPVSAHHPLHRHRGGDHNRQCDGVWSFVCGVHEPARLHHALREGTERRKRQRARGGPDNRLELTPFGGIKDSGLGYKEGVLEAMKSFTNVKTYSIPF